MLTGRVTYGFGRLGQMDPTQPSDTTMTVVPANIAQSTLVQEPVAQWGLGEWAVMLGGLYVAYAVTSTTKRGVRRVRGYREERKKQLSRKHESYADYYKS